MKRSRAAWLAVVIVLLLAASLVLLLPARWVVPLVQPRLHGLALGGVHGSIWNGTADRVAGPDGRPLGALRWQLSRRALWGTLDLRVAFDGPGLVASGHLRRDAQGRPVWTDVSLRGDLAAWTLPMDPSLGVPRGRLTATMARVVLQGSWPVALAGRLQWGDARMETGAGSVALGDLDMALAGTHGVLEGRLHDRGDGPLQVAGQWQASPLGWRLDLRLHPRSADPELHQWLARLGRPAADGSVHLHRRGGLAAPTQEANR